MASFIIIGSGNRNSANRGAVFREVSEGSVPDAHYLSIDALYRGGSALYRLLTNRRLRALLKGHEKLLTAYEHIIDALYRDARSVRMRKLRPLLSAQGPNYLIFCIGTRIDRLSSAVLKQLREACPDCRTVFYLVDSVERTAFMNDCDIPAVLAFLRLFDLACTYDRADARSYGPMLRFIEIPLWRSGAPGPARTTSALYFCGHDKDRRELLLAIFGRLQAHGLRFHCRVVTSVKANQRRLGVTYSKWIPYEVCVAELREANCLLEILAAHNNESTLRYREAVMYNRKFLTNNPDIVEFPYYDARWMRVFQTPGDIDLDWLARVEPVDYGYSGDFSAANFLRKVEALLLRPVASVTGASAGRYEHSRQGG